MKRLSILIIFIGLIATACNREKYPDAGAPVSSENTEEGFEAYGKMVGYLIFDSVVYSVPREELLLPFIREFNDGTVVDKVMIRKIEDNPDLEPTYYLVGLGLNHGAFRSMALELYMAIDKTLYLSQNSRKFVCESVTCSFCFFTYANNRIIDCACSSNNSENLCRHVKSSSNTLKISSRK